MKNKLFAGLLVAGLGIFAFTAFAGAQTTSTVTSTVKEITRAVFNQKIEIGSGGQAHVRGTVVGTSANAIMVKSWGGIWTAEISTGTIILAHGGKAELGDIKTGDQIMVQGNMVEGKAITLLAKVVKDYSLKIANDKKAEKKEVKQELNDLKKEGREEAKKLRKSFVERIKALRINLGKGVAEIQVTGEIVCLPKKNPGEIQTMECAIGISADGKNYALAGDDARELEVGKSVTVSGKLLPAKMPIYDIFGTIKVSDSD